jgi:hypothetical protein
MLLDHIVYASLCSFRLCFPGSLFLSLLLTLAGGFSVSG